MRVAVIGARRTRTGTGAHLARVLVQLGADVAALYGTTEESARDAVETLAASTGHRAQPLWGEDAVLGPDLDALVVAGPDETHARWVYSGLNAHAHVLCEKPLVWATDDPVHTAELLGNLFQSTGLVLKVNAQWPYSLPTYDELFPAVLQEATSFFMRLSPTAAGADMFRVSLSHPLSVLAAVVPDMDARIHDPEVELARTNDEGRIQFVYAGAGRRIDCTVHLVQQAAPPREAAFGFDDHIAHRRIHLPDYTMELEGGGRRVPMPDPMHLLVGSFLDEIAIDQPRMVDPAVVPGMRHLVELMRAVPAQDEPSP